ncbi:MAG TPA: hypothetical protein VLF94_04000 [Chlamydiales bacterium]|nr:hypothetical protein [Chlamydiales bacterium]
MRKWLASLLCLPLFASALEVQPWFGDCLEFHFLGSYAYSYFDRVQGGVPQLKSTFQSNLLYAGLDFSPTPEWSIDTDLQLADTSQMDFNFRTIALQARYLWLDDIIGDRVSLATGANARFTNTASLHDVSCPSHANFDFEFNFSLGKEWDVSDSLAWRLWAFGCLGQANRGSPWVRAIVAVETNYDDQHKFAFLAEGSNGYGRHTTVNVDHFDGYAKIRQKSIDLCVRYGYRVGVWGTLRFEYQRRVLAKSCPAQVNCFVFSYLLPFSL